MSSGADSPLGKLGRQLTESGQKLTAAVSSGGVLMAEVIAQALGAHPTPTPTPNPNPNPTLTPTPNPNSYSLTPNPNPNPSQAGPKQDLGAASARSGGKSGADSRP